MSDIENSEKSQVSVPEVNFIEKLVVLGLNDIMANTKPTGHELRKEYFTIKQKIFADFPDILLPRLNQLNCEIQNKILEGVFVENAAALLDEKTGWWTYINNTISMLDEQDIASFYNYTSLYVLLNRIKDMREEVNWYNIFLKLGDATTAIGNKCEGFMTVLNWLIQADPENLRKIIYRTESKSYPSNLKADLYKRSIDLGIFDVKIARRVRSDTSGTLSSEILSYLFENRFAFTDDVFQDLVTQFSDTKHKWVARYIAINMPMHLIPFLMGIKDDVALSILEKRMEVAEN